MADLRTEIRHAFEAEQSVFPPPPAMRHEVVEGVVAAHSGNSVDRRGQPNLQWVAIAAAILITVAIVAGLMSVRLAQRQVPGRPSPATSTPTPKDYGPPPDGVALLYVVDPNHPGWLIGFDWTGRPRATVKLAQPVDPLSGFSQSPDGSAFAYGFYGKGAARGFLDRLGQPIGGISQNHAWVMWADDARHVCTLDGANGQWKLGLLLPGEAAAKTSMVAMDSNNLRSGIYALSFAGCSARNDQAVVAYSYAGRSSEYWVFRISDGKTLAHRTFGTDQEVNFVASPDGTLIAENSAKSTGQVAPAAPSTIVRRISDMSLVATLDSSVAVLGFNSDGSLALLATTPWASGVATHLQLIDPRTGAAVWRYDAAEQLSSLLVQPGGRDFAVLLQDPRDSTSPASVDVVIVHGDGTSTQIPGRYINLQ